MEWLKAHWKHIKVVVLAVFAAGGWWARTEYLNLRRDERLDALEHSEKAMKAEVRRAQVEAQRGRVAAEAAKTATFQAKSEILAQMAKFSRILGRVESKLDASDLEAVRGDGSSALVPYPVPSRSEVSHDQSIPNRPRLPGRLLPEPQS